MATFEKKCETCTKWSTDPNAQYRNVGNCLALSNFNAVVPYWAFGAIRRTKSYDGTHCTAYSAATKAQMEQRKEFLGYEIATEPTEASTTPQVWSHRHR